MSRDNIRRAQQPGSDPQLVLVASLFVLLLAATVAVHLALVYSNDKNGLEDAVPWNPINLFISLAKGQFTWTTDATIVTAVLSVIFAFIAAGFWWLIRKPKAEKRVDQVRHLLGSSRDMESFSKKKATDLSKKWLPEQLAEKYPGLKFGTVVGNRKRGLYSSWEDLYLVIFGPRMGKTTTQVIPAIVDAPGVVMTTSNKRDIVDETVAFTSARGNVWVFDPQRIAAGFDQNPWFFDPLDSLRENPDMMDSAALALADIFLCAQSGDTSGGDSYFHNAGRDLTSRLLMAAAIGGRPISDVFIWANDDSDRTPVAILSGDGGWDQQASALAATYSITERTRSGIFSQAAQMVAPLGRKEAVKWVTPTAGARRFIPADFVRTAHDTLYVLSKEGPDSAAALTTALVASIMQAAERYGEANGGRLPVPLVAALDEAANVVRWPELPKLYSHYGSRSIILMTILQSYAQGVSVWGEEGMEALWSASAIMLYGGGVRDEKMLSKMVELIGDAEERSKSVSSSRDGRSVSTSLHEKKILTVAELSSLEQGRAIVFATKHRPILAELEPWWERPWPQETKDLLRITKA
ncbi:type IV secretory system conjugative DNA transfer family protein [Corynebacterium callunae]|uniref:TraD/TraG TraM recognition site domain-containing protein n=1 Tax=Corynebacterium callunae DSM 20147 TaxID=1121353 RepID=M1UDX1_9CORY|nr:type IV secretory system conjugative DNA transfer family protein [Corynebacterium callunae]AGG66195.1 hypothetical protein H924_03735 [Corynebacterium callunae DSM 20147]